MFRIGFNGFHEKSSRLSKDDANLSDNNSIRKNIHLNKKHQTILAKIDKKGVHNIFQQTRIERGEEQKFHIGI
jgi:hypothetical protein